MPKVKRSLPSEVTLEIGLDEPREPTRLRERVARELGLDVEALPSVILRKSSLDCRRGRVRYHLLFELTPTPLAEGFGFGIGEREALGAPHPVEVRGTPKVVVIGDGPCGLFCAYELARAGIASVVVDRGKPVQPRRRDLKGLTRKGTVDADSNYCFGEGGAGTYSDGKLYTRSHKRGDVRDVLEILALHGAPQEILVDARPHIGSNKLPEVVTALRERLESVGVEFRFGARVVDVMRDNAGRASGVRLLGGESIEASHVVLATGHSARDIYALLLEAGHALEAKPFALGLRIEHPQPLINRIQYGNLAEHPELPSAAYRLVDSRADRPVFSFCMCPGGFIVPAMTEPGQVVVNGMSPSRRNSRYANSGMVVGVEPAALAAIGLTGPLAGIELQRRIERATFEAGGGELRAPATRVTDFIAGRASSSLPASSYQPGLTPSDVGAVLDSAGVRFADALREALRHFGRSMRGYVSEEAVLVAVESRTSAPLRIPRHAETLESLDWPGFYPAGEGAGYAGGIVSAAVDGMRVAREIVRAPRARGS
ncbi:MAG TPA: FAD-dependent oxidoreductase [Polyangiaceae bacterium]|nr:FAD-dependent oxidoreductase [Polyangiaceae bacterium]